MISLIRSQHSSLYCFLILCGAVFAEPPATPDFPNTDWPWWRGETRDGVAATGQQPPLTWSETENVLWSADIPGRGHGTPIFVGDHVYLATADEEKETQSVLCYSRKTGKQLWQTVVHSGGLMPGNKKASHASSSVACDGERLFINFLHDGAAYTTALDLAGKQLWQQKICAYKVHQGYGSSPAIYKHLVIVSADNKLGGAIMAMDRKDGKIVWKRDRPKMPNYPSPIILNIGGKDQLIMTGCELVTSLNPLTGEENWEIEGATTECVTTTPTDGKHVYSSGGYPKNHVAAIVADGSGEVVWENNTRVYVPSLLIKDGYLYGVADNGVAMCWDSASGKEMWKGRLGGNFTASPVLLDDKIMATNETGKTFIFHADPKEFTLIGTNELGDQVYSSPVIVGNQIFFRAAYFAGKKRSEKLICLGK